MIARLWRGRTNDDNADAYQELLRTTILPGIHRVAGYRGAYVLRRPVPGGAEFVTMTLFDSLEAIKGFAGEDYEVAVVLPEAHRFLAEFDGRATHYEVVVEPS